MKITLQGTAGEKSRAQLTSSKPRVVLTHGDVGPRATLAKQIAERHGLTPQLPALGESIAL